MQRQVEKPTAVLVEDNPVVLAAVYDLLRNDCKVLATVNDGLKAMEAIRLHNPDIAIFDIGIAGMNGFETARFLRAEGHATRIVFLTIMEDRDYAAAIHELNASYVVKRRMHTDLIHAIHETMAGRQFFSPLLIKQASL